uniref:STEAP family member 2, metalloreductase n=1 Tax=Oryzias latipes TaxID=8090 RepID=A0A3P9J8R4_ORYLA
MDSAFIIGHKRSPGLMSASSAHHLHSAQTFWVPKVVRARAADLGPSGLRPAPTTLAILGSGDFSKSLAFRLLRCGFCVVVGSRHPKLAAQSFPHVVDVTHYEDAVRKANIVFLAIRREHYSVLWDLKHLLAGKILVDVSNNRRGNQYAESNAEYLASLLPDSVVVKGFNVISAWAMQQNYPQDASTQVFVCSDSVEARQQIMELAHQLNFQPVDMGTLSSSRYIENIPRRLFHDWKGPVLAAVAFSIFFFSYSFARDIIHPYFKYKQSDFYKIPIEIVNRTLPTVAITLLALVYLPGQLAAIHQLYYGTKYKLFPKWLEGWLQSRKQLGLISFFLTAVHGLYSLCLPFRRSERYLLLNTAYQQVHAHVENSWNEEEVWRVEMYISFGIMSFGLLSILAITSVPSINTTLNWREFSFIQSTLGYIALLIATFHGLLFGWKQAFEKNAYHFYLPPSFMVALVLPVCVIMGKVFMLMPCVACKLKKIHMGMDRSLHGCRRLEPVGSAANVSPERVTIM